MRPRSIRARITAIATVVVAFVLLIAGVVVVVIVQDQLRDDLDRSLEQRADQVAAAALDTPGETLANSNIEDRFAQVIAADGSVVLATSNVAGEPALAERPAAQQAATTRDDLPVEDDAYRILSRRIDDVAGNDGYVIVGENIDDVRDGVRALIATLTLVFPLAVAALAGAIWWLVGRTLRPVEAIRVEVASIGLDQLDRRVDEPSTGDEVARLASTMNDMLERLEGAVERQRTFVADASHELRTPLTRLRTVLEVDLASGDIDLGPTCRQALADTIEMHRLIDDLLFLARHDAVDSFGAPEPLDLDVIVDEQIRSIRDDPACRCRIEMSAVTGAMVRGHRSQLERVVRNIAANAVRHARSAVSVSLVEDDAVVVLTVADDGPGVPVGERERVFERFVRLDAARNEHDGGAGLGLAIVHDIVTAHGGRVWIDDSPSGGALVRVELPAC